ncbi:MAG TPA: hypothetical protein PLR65_10585 [Anaerolineales bacterium]|nr:hypothetical protein [Anaerolineales bacterium]
MDEQSNAPIFLPPAGGSGGRMLAIASLILGVMSLCGWFLPICSVPLCVAGAVLGYLAMNDASQENLATVGMALSTSRFRLFLRKSDINVALRKLN